jgi:hypothetical protein
MFAAPLKVGEEVDEDVGLLLRLVGVPAAVPLPADSTALTRVHKSQPVKSIMPGTDEFPKISPGAERFLAEWNGGQEMSFVDGSAFSAIALHAFIICPLR